MTNNAIKTLRQLRLLRGLQNQDTVIAVPNFMVNKENVQMYLRLLLVAKKASPWLVLVLQVRISIIVFFLILYNMHYTQRTSCADTFIRDTWQSFHIWSCAEFQLHINKKNANNQLNVHCWYCSHFYVWDIEWKNIFSQEEIFCNFSFPFLTPQSKNFLFFVFHHKTRAWTCGFTRVPRLLKRDSPVSNFLQDLRVKNNRIVRWQLFSLCWACWHALPFHNVNPQRKFP